MNNHDRPHYNIIVFVACISRWTEQNEPIQMQCKRMFYAINIMSLVLLLSTSLKAIANHPPNQYYSLLCYRASVRVHRAARNMGVRRHCRSIFLYFVYFIYCTMPVNDIKCNALLVYAHNSPYRTTFTWQKNAITIYVHCTARYMH